MKPNIVLIDITGEKCSHRIDGYMSQSFSRQQAMYETIFDVVNAEYNQGIVKSSDMVFICMPDKAFVVAAHSVLYDDHFSQSPNVGCLCCGSGKIIANGQWYPCLVCRESEIADTTVILNLD